jgi:3-hydroxyisobutyrate dehydrogenase
MKVSFIGIGNMGTPMAAHLIARGFDVTVFDVRQEAAREFVTAHGGKMVRRSRKLVAMSRPQ